MAGYMPKNSPIPADTTRASAANSVPKLVVKVWVPRVRPSRASGHPEPNARSQESTPYAERGGLCHELKEDVAPLCAHRPADAYLTGAFGD